MPNSFKKKLKMVQGERTSNKNTSDGIMERNKDSKRAGFNSMHGKNSNSSKDSEKKSQDNRNYGAWGSINKNRDHFVNLHMC